MTKNILITAIGIIGSFITSAFGGWSTGLTTLVIFMAIYYNKWRLVKADIHNRQ